MADMTVTDPAHPSHLVERFLAMRTAGELCDYEIKGHSRSFHIHSLVLAAASPVFKTMLLTEMKESVKKEATFPSISDDNLSQVIEFAYTGTCTFSRTELVDLISAAHYLEISKLLKMCEEQIRDVLEPSNCFSWLRFADRLQLTVILPHVQNTMRAAFTKIFMADEFQKLQLSEVDQYLGDVGAHGASSDDMLRGALQWIKHDAQERSANMPQLLSHIRVNKCTARFLQKTMTENAELFDMQSSVYKLMLSDFVTSMPQLFGEDKTILVLGGQNADESPNSELWLLNEEQMEKYGDVAAEYELQPHHSVCQVPDGMMITGGRQSDMCIMFVVATKKWVKMTSLRNTRYCHVSGCIGGKLLVISGIIGAQSNFSACVDVMDLQDNTWHNGPSLPTAGRFPKVVVFGTTMFVLLPEEYGWYKLDADTMSWSMKSPLVRSFGCSLAASEHRIFAVGGSHLINYMYVPTSDAWFPLTRPILQERQGSLVYHRNKLYLLAGCVVDAALTDVLEYDIDADKWSLARWKLPKPLALFKACLVDIPK